MAKKTKKVPAKRSSEAASLRFFVPKVIPDKRGRVKHKGKTDE